jgi:hypothetical protein
MLGSNVCRAHGGAAPQTRAKAQRRLDQAADGLVQRLLGFALDGEVADREALLAIRDALDRAGITAKYALELSAATEPKPYEEVFAGIAKITRAESHARRGLPAPPELDVVDAELVPPQALPVSAPSAAVGAAERPSRADAPANEPAAPTAPIVLTQAILTYEEAAVVMRASRVRTQPARRKRRVRRVR